jgi:hypothetical protein
MRLAQIQQQHNATQDLQLQRFDVGMRRCAQLARVIAPVIFLMLTAVYGKVFVPQNASVSLRVPLFRPASGAASATTTSLDVLAALPSPTWPGACSNKFTDGLVEQFYESAVSSDVENARISGFQFVDVTDRVMVKDNNSRYSGRPDAYPHCSSPRPVYNPVNASEVIAWVSSCIRAGLTCTIWLA